MSIDRRVLNPAIDELKVLIGLEVHKKYSNKGEDPKLEGYWFSLKLNKEKLKQCNQLKVDSSNILGKILDIVVP